MAEDPAIEAALPNLLRRAEEAPELSLPDEDIRESLETRHHERWTAAREMHEHENRRLVEHRLQSLTTSHQARAKIIADQLLSATNDKIRLMKQSEQFNAEVDFQKRLKELQQAANSGDIRVTPVAFGTLGVERNAQ